MNIAVTDISIKPASERAFETLLHLKLLNEQEEMTEIAKGDLAEEDACFSAPNFRLDSKDAFKENADVAAECAKYDGTILLVRAGEHNAQVVERAINFLEEQPLVRLCSRFCCPQARCKKNGVQDLRSSFRNGGSDVSQSGQYCRSAHLQQQR